VQLQQAAFCCRYNKMLLVVAAITFNFYRKFYCKFYCTCDQSIMQCSLCMCIGIPAWVVVKHGVESWAAATEAARDDTTQAAVGPPGLVSDAGHRAGRVDGGTRDGQPRRQWRTSGSRCADCSSWKRSNMTCIVNLPSSQQSTSQPRC